MKNLFCNLKSRDEIIKTINKKLVDFTCSWDKKAKVIYLGRSELTLIRSLFDYLDFHSVEGNPTYEGRQVIEVVKESYFNLSI